MKNLKVLLVLVAFAATVGIVSVALAEDESVASSTENPPVIIMDPDITPPTLEIYTISETLISPNGDGDKDTTTIDVKFSEKVKYKIAIVDVGSNEVKNWSGEATNPESKVWDGKKDGNVVTSGVYTVKIEGTDYGDNVVTDESETITVQVDTPATHDPKDADVNGDDVVDSEDIDLVRDCLGQNPTPSCEDEDVNNDGKLNNFDVLFVRGHLGEFFGDPADVDPDDIDLVRECLGQNSAPNCEDEDVNGDDIVNNFDVLFVRGHFDQLAPADETSGNPDPIEDSQNQNGSGGGSSRISLPISPGQVLGASTVNWDALTEEEREELISPFRQQILDFIQQLLVFINTH